MRVQSRPLVPRAAAVLRWGHTPGLEGETFGREVSRPGPWLTLTPPLLPAASPAELRRGGLPSERAPTPRQRPPALLGGGGVCSLLKYCVCGFVGPVGRSGSICLSFWTCVRVV